MGLFRTALIGAGLYAAYKYITKPDEITGKTIVDDLKEKAPEWIDKARAYKEDLEAKYLNDDLAK
ncbi:MAG: YtxH domain-containing protein [Pedobacter sp.]|nr:MAG: YtxH domain-containing protein [Pedobacter sp.]